MPDLTSAAAEAAAASGEVRNLVLLGTDVAGNELRDIVRITAAEVSGAIEVVPLGEIDSEGRHALAAAANEAGERVVISPAMDAGVLPDIAIGAGTNVIWGRASALIQIGIPQPAADRGIVLVHDPVGAIDTNAAPPVEWDEVRGAPTVASIPGALFSAALRAAPRGMLTGDGVMAAVLRVLSRAGLLEVQRSPLITFYPGSAGSGAGLPGGHHTPASLDAEMLAILDEDDPS